MRKILVLCLSFFALSHLHAQQVAMQPKECWWGIGTGVGTQLPISDHTFEANTRVENFNNQTAPLLLSNQGRAIWLDAAYRLKVSNRVLQFQPAKGGIDVQVYGKTLRDAYLGAMKSHFPATGEVPPSLFFERPIYNSWIELLYNQNQADILKYAHNIIDNGFAPGILIIDDNWQQDYGEWEFRAEKFPNPKQMIDELHSLGFKVMLWVCPYVSPDSKKSRDFEAKGFFVKAKGTNQAVVARWWNGHSFVYDLSNPEAYNQIRGELKDLQKRYDIDGFKFDAGDSYSYLEENVDVYDGKSFDIEQTYLWAALGREFQYNEMRACWKHGNEGLVQRLGDKKYSWVGVSQLVPDMISAGLLGYAFTCPDMIGGGEYGSFYNVDEDKFDQTLIIRSCQIHAMMPMMQFSVAPWRILSKENLAIVRQYAHWHTELGPYILEQARKSAQTGEPIVRHMAYCFPNEGFEHISDQYMFGDKYLVAPVTTAENHRTVKLPKGKWRDDQGKVYVGGKVYSLNVPLARLPWFVRIK